ncbi:hypothetical protein JCM5353_001063 [Sporobolomyces roseus]
MPLSLKRLTLLNSKLLSFTLPLNDAEVGIATYNRFEQKVIISARATTDGNVLVLTALYLCSATLRISEVNFFMQVQNQGEAAEIKKERETSFQDELIFSPLSYLAHFNISPVNVDATPTPTPTPQLLRRSPSDSQFITFDSWFSYISDSDRNYNDNDKASCYASFINDWSTRKGHDEWTTENRELQIEWWDWKREHCRDDHNGHWNGGSRARGFR